MYYKPEAHNRQSLVVIHDNICTTAIMKSKFIFIKVEHEIQILLKVSYTNNNNIALNSSISILFMSQLTFSLYPKFIIRKTPEKWFETINM